MPVRDRRDDAAACDQLAGAERFGHQRFVLVGCIPVTEHGDDLIADEQGLPTAVCRLQKLVVPDARHAREHEVAGTRRCALRYERRDRAERHAARRKCALGVRESRRVDPLR